MSETNITTITDKQAVEVLNTTKPTKLNIADTFVPRTIFHAVEIEYKPGVKTVEIRSFVRQSEYCSARQWEYALELEKQFPELNKGYEKVMKAQKRPYNLKAPGNPLKATLLENR
jgi:hypothetical protein